LTPLLLADGLMGSGRRARAHEQITHTPLVQLRGYWMASEAKGKPGHQPIGFRCGWASSLRTSEHLLVQSNKGVRCAGAPAQEHAQLAWKVPWSVQHRGITHALTSRRRAKCCSVVGSCVEHAGSSLRNYALASQPSFPCTTSFPGSMLPRLARLAKPG
jgi:hypothetical protein